MVEAMDGKVISIYSQQRSRSFVCGDCKYEYVQRAPRQNEMTPPLWNDGGGGGEFRYECPLSSRSDCVLRFPAALCSSRKRGDFSE